MSYSLEQRISREQLAEFCRSNHIRKLSLLGSALRGTSRPDSDIDRLVEFETDRTPGLFSIVRMERELSKARGKKVDLRTPEDLSPHFRNEVVENARVQYQA